MLKTVRTTPTVWTIINIYTDWQAGKLLDPAIKNCSAMNCPIRRRHGNMSAGDLWFIHIYKGCARFNNMASVPATSLLILHFAASGNSCPALTRTCEYTTSEARDRTRLDGISICLTWPDSAVQICLLACAADMSTNAWSTNKMNYPSQGSRDKL